MKKIIIILIFIIAGFWTQLNGQYYDGKLDLTTYLGVEPGKDAIACFGANAGLNKYLSVGGSIQYLFNTDKNLEYGTGIGFTLSADLHGFYLFNMKKSDLLAGYNYTNGSSGVQVEYRKFLSEFFGFYGSTKYYFSPVPVSVFENQTIDNQFRFQLGVVFKFVSGKEYKVDF